MTQAPKKRRALKFFLFLLLLLVLVVALLPTIASSTWAREKILTKVNESAPGTLDVKVWSLGWLGELNARGLTYTDEGGTTLVKVKQVDVSYGLLDLIRRKKNLTLTLTEPHVLVPAGSAGSAVPPPAKSGARAPGGVASAPAPAPTPAPTPEAPAEPVEIGKVLQKLPASVNLVVKEGVVNLQGQGAYMHNLELDTTFRKADRALELRSSFDAPDGSGKMVVQGHVDVPEGDTINPLESVVDLAVDGSNWDLAPALAFGRSYVPGLPGGTARLQSKIDVKGSPAEGFSAQGNASLLGVDLEGGVLAGDRPRFSEARFDFDAVQRGSEILLKKLDVQSPYLNGSLAAELVGLPSEIDSKLPPFDLLQQILGARGTAAGAFQVNLPILFEQFPNHLSLQEGLTVTGGEIALGINASLGDERQWAVVSLGLEKALVAERAGAAAVAIQPPMVATGMIDRVGEAEPLVVADVASTFLAGRAELSRQKLAANFGVNLSQARSELGKIFDFGEWDFAGEGVVQANIGNYDQAENHIDFGADLKRLLVKKGGTAFLDEPVFIGSGKATVNRETLHLSKGELVADSQIIKGTGRFDSIQLAKDGPPSEVAGLKWDGSLNLERGVNLLKGLGVVTNDVSASGVATLNLNVGMEGDTIVLPPTTLSLDQLKLAMRDPLGKLAQFEDPSLQVSLQGRLDPKAESINLPALSLSSRLARVKVGDVIASNYSSAESRKVSLSVQEGVFQLGAIGELLRATGLLEQDLTVGGVARLSPTRVQIDGEAVSFDPTTVAIDRLALALRGEDGRVQQYEDPRLELSLSGSLDLKKEIFDLPQLALKSRLAQVKLGAVRATDVSKPASRQLDARLEQAEFQLGPIVELLRATGIVEQDLTLGGVATLSATQVGVKGEALTLDPTTLVIDRLSLALRDAEGRLQQYEDPRLELSLGGTADPKKGVFDLPQLALKSRLANVKLSKVQASNVSKPTARRAGGTIEQGEFQLGPIVELLRASGVLTNQLTASGTAVLSGTQAEVTGSQARLPNANLTIFRPELSLVSDGTTRQFKDDQITVSLQNASANLDTKAVTAGNITLQAGFGSMRVDDFDGTKLDDEARTVSAHVNGTLQLRLLGDLMSTLGVMPPTLSMAGVFNPEASLKLTGQDVLVSTRQTSFENVSIASEGKVLQPVSGSLAGDFRINLDRRSLDARALDFGLRDQGELLKVGPGSVRVGDWSNALQSLAADATLRADLGALVAKAGPFAPMPEGMAIAGLLDGKVSTTGQGEGQTLNLNSHIRGFKFYKDNKPLLEEEQVTLNANAKRDLVRDRLVVEGIQFQSTPLQLSAHGSVNRMSRKDKAVILDGELGFDLDRLQPIVRELTGQPITMKGKKLEPFNLTTTLGDNMIANTTLRANFFAEYIEAFGIPVNNLHLPVNIINGFGDVHLRSGIAGGLLDVHPRIGTMENVEGLVISLPPNSSVLTNFTLTSEMTEGLLGKLHPVFKGTAVSGGKVDLFMNNLTAPVDSLEQIKFAGSIGLQGARLEANGIIRLLMNLMKVRETTFTVDDTIMGFQAVNQRVYSGDLKIRIDGVPVVIGGRSPQQPGSVGFDKTIDFVARVPLTGHMVPAELAKYAGTNFVVSLPLFGTVDKPRLDERSLQSAIVDLTQQIAIRAAQKAAGDKLGELLGGNADAGDAVGNILGGILGGNRNTQPNPDLQSTDRPGMQKPAPQTPPFPQPPHVPRQPDGVVRQPGQVVGGQGTPAQGTPAQGTPGQPQPPTPPPPAPRQPDIFDQLLGGKPAPPAAPGETPPKRSSEDELKDIGKGLLRDLFK